MLFCLTKPTVGVIRIYFSDDFWAERQERTMTKPECSIDLGQVMGSS